MMMIAGDVYAAYQAYLTMLQRDISPNETTFQMLIDWHLLGKDTRSALHLYRTMLAAGFTPDLPL